MPNEAKAMLPNFLIVGAPKCGTTSLYRYIGQHPEVYFPHLKEPQYFAFANQTLSFKGPGVTVNENAVTALDDYQALFSEVSGQTAIGEASALYLSSPEAAARIKSLLPSVQLIAILRDPVARAFSSYMHLRRDGREPITSFELALAAEEKRIADNWGFLWRYKALGRYHEQLQRYYELFDKEQILVLLHDDLRDNPAATLQRIFSHINVDSQIQIDTSTRHNISGLPKNRRLYDLLKGDNLLTRIAAQAIPANARRYASTMINKHLVKPETLSSTLRQTTVEYFREDIGRLEQLLQRDLSHWLSV